MPESSASKWVKCIVTEGNIRGVAIQATDLVRSMAEAHSAKGLSAQGLGEAVVAGLLVGSYCKPGEHANLNIRGSGHFQQALVDAYPDGTVRGYVIERPVDQIPVADLKESGPWGEGVLCVLRTRDGEKSRQPYIGTVPLVTGHLAKDLTFYWAQSEQTPSAVGIVVDLDGEEIGVAGGFMIQALPGASPAEVKAIEQHIQSLDSLGATLSKNAGPMRLLSEIFQNTAFMVLEERPLEFKCSCTWERVERALALVGVQELQAMLTEDHSATVRCDFCSKEYQVSGDQLQRMIDQTAKK